MRNHLRTIATTIGATALIGVALTACSAQNTTATTTLTTKPSAAAAATTADEGTGSLRSGQCTTPDLAASITPGDGAAGHAGVVLVLTNTGTDSCTVQGWPGLSLVGGGNGTQIGAAADFDKTSPHGTVTLAAGGTAHAVVEVAEAGNYDAGSCRPTPADGFRIYPPGEKRSLFAADTDFQGCANTSLTLLTVGALQPGSAS
jgi:hypothetical protein